jgi:hypothetical protein
MSNFKEIILQKDGNATMQFLGTIAGYELKEHKYSKDKTENRKK